MLRSSTSTYIQQAADEVQETKIGHLKSDKYGHFGSALHGRGRLRNDSVHAVLRAGWKVQVFTRQLQLHIKGQ